MSDLTAARRVKRTPLGVYSTAFEASPGSATKGKRILWCAAALEDGHIEVQPLNKRMIPIGQPRILSRDRFIASFTHEPGHYVGSLLKPPPPVTPKANAPTNAARPKPRRRSVTQIMAAVRDEGRRYMLDGKVDKAMAVYQRILNHPGPLVPDDKYLFNDCGIDLRKAGRLEEAVAFYLKALTAEETDEHLYHNAARALYQNGRLDEARRYLRLSLALNPDLEASRRFLKFMDKRHPASGTI